MKRPLGEMETIFKALADSTRLRILGLLLAGEVCVCHIHAALRISQPKASRHLAYLRRAGLVTTRRAGTWMHYRLADAADPVLSAVQRSVRHALQHQTIVRKDLERLEKAAGCSVAPIETSAPSRPCCSTSVRGAA
ncbi:MAG TPA: metalloregulator ArsR/SmtB family transcription factor [Vicinamibacterales bacterium]|jgi:ArsR family transcriptional regulator